MANPDYYPPFTYLVLSRKALLTVKSVTTLEVVHEKQSKKKK